MTFTFHIFRTTALAACVILINMKKNIPFFANIDNTHCYQAALKIVLNFFLPEKNFTWEELEILTAKVKGLWTWPTHGLINLHRMGFEIIDMDDFSFDKFIKEGGNYLIRRYGKEVGESQIKHSDIEQEKKIYVEYKKLNLHQEVLPVIEDVKRLIDQGYLVVCNVNSGVLNNKSGYSGHFVVIFDYTDTHLILHDPGLPPFPFRRILYTNFLRAWEYPNARSKNILAFKFAKK